MYLLDTNIVSEARRGTPEAVDWLRSINRSSIHLSVITLGWIRRGIIAKQKSDPKTAARLAIWFEDLRRDHASRILPVTDDIAIEWGRIAVIRPRGMADGLIAATAIIHGLTVVTRNRTDFEDTKVPMINPWDRPA